MFLQVKGDITYNGYRLDEFVPQKTSSYISQSDLHLGELTVRETLDFSSRCQGIGSKYGIPSLPIPPVCASYNNNSSSSSKRHSEFRSRFQLVKCHSIDRRFHRRFVTRSLSKRERARHSSRSRSRCLYEGINTRDVWIHKQGGRWVSLPHKNFLG